LAGHIAAAECRFLQLLAEHADPGRGAGDDRQQRESDRDAHLRPAADQPHDPPDWYGERLDPEPVLYALASTSDHEGRLKASLRSAEREGIRQGTGRN
jgi:hypothetical protein